MKRILLLLVIATVAIGGATGFAATLNIGSHHLWAGSQSLTKGSCTVTGAATDTYVDQAHPTTAFSTSSTLGAAVDSGSQEWTFLNFSLSSCSLPTTAGADSATLSLYMVNAPKSSMTLDLAKVTSSWSSSLTWNAAQSVTTTSTTSTTVGTSTGVWVTFTVTGDVDGFIKGGTNYGWRVSESGTAHSLTKDLVQFPSTNSGSNVPKLTINYEK